MWSKSPLINLGASQVPCSLPKFPPCTISSVLRPSAHLSILMRNTVPQRTRDDLIPWRGDCHFYGDLWGWCTPKITLKSRGREIQRKGLFDLKPRCVWEGSSTVVQRALEMKMMMNKSVSMTWPLPPENVTNSSWGPVTPCLKMLCLLMSCKHSWFLSGSYPGTKDLTLYLGIVKQNLQTG